MPVSVAFEEFTVGDNHTVVALTLKQGTRDVQFKAKSSDAATGELMTKWGAELGVTKVVAAKFITDYEKKNSITHAKDEETTYTINAPTHNHRIDITSRR